MDSRNWKMVTNHRQPVNWRAAHSQNVTSGSGLNVAIVRAAAGLAMPAVVIDLCLAMPSGKEDLETSHMEEAIRAEHPAAVPVTTGGTR